MNIKGIRDEDFVNYRKPSMYLIASTCSFKCDRENGESCCQNSSLASQPSKWVDDDTLVKRYLSNPITKAIVCGGLEPFDSFDELYALIDCLREKHSCMDDVVIYTGYTPDEIWEELRSLAVSFPNIIVKFGRFRPSFEPHYDEVLGVNLASDNQWAEKIS